MTSIENEVLGLYPLGNPLPPLQGTHIEQWRRNWTQPSPGVVQTKGPWPWSGKWGLPVVTPGLSGMDDEAYGFFWAIPAIAGAVGAAVGAGKKVADAVGGSKKKKMSKAQTRAFIRSFSEKRKRAAMAARRKKRMRRKRQRLRRKRHETQARVGESRERMTRVSKFQRDPDVVHRQMVQGADMADASLLRAHALRAPGDPRLAHVLNVQPNVFALRQPGQPAGGPSMPWYSKPVMGGMPTGTAMAIGVGGLAILFIAMRRK